MACGRCEKTVDPAVRHADLLGHGFNSVSSRFQYLVLISYTESKPLVLFVAQDRIRWGWKLQDTA